jgi:hypothetical protein
MSGKLLAIVSLLGAILQADPISCSPGTFASYEALGSTGCTVGPFTVKDFSFTVLSGSGSVTDSTILVTPTNSALTVWGLNFASGGFSVTGSESVQYLLAYTWDPTDDIQSLDDIMDPPFAVPLGFAKVTTDACLNAAFSGPVCSTSTVSISVFQDGVSPQLFAAVSFSPVPVLGIRNVIDLEAKGASAGFDSLTNEVAIVPEPSTALTGLVMIILLAVRLRCASARLRL